MHGPVHGGPPAAAPGSTGPHGAATAVYAPRGSRTRVTVLGELDLDSARSLWPDLFQALADSATGLDLDLTGVGFCDCAGFNLLLDLRRRAVSQSKTITIDTVGPPVARLLVLLDAGELFLPPSPPSPHHPSPAPEPGRSRAIASSGPARTERG